MSPAPVHVIPFDPESAAAWETMKTMVRRLVAEGRLRPELAEQLSSDAEAVQWQWAFRRQRVLLTALNP